MLFIVMTSLFPSIYIWLDHINPARAPMGIEQRNINAARLQASKNRYKKKKKDFTSFGVYQAHLNRKTLLASCAPSPRALSSLLRLSFWVAQS